MGSPILDCNHGLDEYRTHLFKKRDAFVCNRCRRPVIDTKKLYCRVCSTSMCVECFHKIYGNGLEEEQEKLDDNASIWEELDKIGE
jgi:hypothetical protein